jgi:hypothetical protein
MVNVQLPLDDGRMGDDLAVKLEQNVDSPEGVLPVVLREALPVLLERSPEETPDCRDVGRRQV